MMDDPECPAVEDGGWVTGSPEAVSAALELLSNRRRRLLLRCLRDHGDEPVEVDSLLSAWSSRCAPEPETLAVEAYHVHLPKIESAGVIDHDEASGTIRYLDDPIVDRILAHLHEADLQE